LLERLPTHDCIYKLPHIQHFHFNPFNNCEVYKINLITIKYLAFAEHLMQDYENNYAKVDVTGTRRETRANG
jgi:hypothetical protein